MGHKLSSWATNSAPAPNLVLQADEVKVKPVENSLCMRNMGETQAKMARLCRESNETAAVSRLCETTAGQKSTRAKGLPRVCPWLVMGLGHCGDPPRCGLDSIP